MNVEASEMNVESCTELASHTNMPVVGKHAYIIAEAGKKVDVAPFTPDYNHLQYPWWMLQKGMTTHTTGNHTYWYYGMHSMSRRWTTTLSHHSC